MRILDTLPKHLLIPQKPRVRMMAPKRICRTIGTPLFAQLFERRFMAISLQIVNDPSTDDAIDISMDIPRLEPPVSDKVQVVKHYDIGEYQKPG